MRINKKIMFIFCITLITLLVLPTNALCQTTIGDSTFPAEEGDFFSWKCTYSHPVYDWILGDGSYQNITVDNIYRGSASMGGFIEYALIVEVTEGRYYAGLDQHDSWPESPYIVYNKSLNHLYLEDVINPIVPIPLNLSLIADSVGGDYTIEGNTITLDYGSGEFKEYRFNSNGIATSWKYIENSTTAYIFKLENGEEEIIPAGFYFIIPSVSIVFCLVIIIKKHSFYRKNKVRE